MLDAQLKTQLQGYLQKLVQPIELVATLGADGKSAELRELLEEIASLSDRIAFRDGGDAARTPSFEIRRVGSDVAVAFAGIPLGHEFASLVLALAYCWSAVPEVGTLLAHVASNLDALEVVGPRIIAEALSLVSAFWILKRSFRFPK